jgi:hypothetical protein
MILSSSRLFCCTGLCGCYSSDVLCNYYSVVLGFEVEKCHISYFVILIKLPVAIWGILLLYSNFQIVLPFCKEIALVIS